MDNSRVWWFVSSAFSMLSALVIYVIIVMLSNMKVIELQNQGAATVELHNTLAAFSTIYGIGLVLGLFVLFVFFALLAGFHAEEVE